MERVMDSTGTIRREKRCRYKKQARYRWASLVPYRSIWTNVLSKVGERIENSTEYSTSVNCSSYRQIPDGKKASSECSMHR